MDTQKLQILLIDDEPLSLKASQMKLEEYVLPENIHTATNAVDVMRVMNTIPIDIAFVDLEMPETDGFTIVDFIRQTQLSTQVVFLTGHVEFGAKSYDYEPLDFLSKPLDVLRLKRTFDKYERAVAQTGQNIEKLALDGMSGFILINPSDIVYISHEGRKNVLHMKNGTREVKTSLDELEVILGEYGLFRCHQSFIVQMNLIVSVVQSDFGRTYAVNLKNGENIPVSRSKYPVLRDKLSRKGVRFL